MSASADAGQTPIVPSPPITPASPAQLRIGLAQVNPTLGAIDDNCELVMKYVKHGAQGGAHLVVFPEMVVTGYPVEDLALRSAFRLASRNAVAQLATQLSLSGLGEIVVVVGYFCRSKPSIIYVYLANKSLKYSSRFIISSTNSC